MTEDKSQYTALVPRQSLTPDLWAMFQSIDLAAYQSRRFGVTQGETAIKLMFCLENGLPLSTANTGLYVVNGRLGVMANVIAAQIHQSGQYDYKIERADDKGCTIAIYGGGEKLGTATFDEDDARLAGLLGKNNYQTYPEDMYFARAISRAYRRFCPEIFSGPVYVSGEVIEGEWSNITPTPAPAAPTITLDTLLTQYSAEEIMAANNGKIPATDEEVRAVAEKLGVK